MRWKLLFLFFLLHTSGEAQVVYDEILLTNGVEYKGKVVEITASEIRFSHKGETLVYTLPKSQVFRIAFASGRTEIFTQVDAPALQESGSMAGSSNPKLVAVLPFRYIQNNFPANWEDMAYRIQEEAIRLAVAAPLRYQIQPAATTNAILLKKGINPQQLRAYTMDELCSILGVGHIITGEIQVLYTGATQTGTQTTYQNNRPVVRPTQKPGQTVTTTTTTYGTNRVYEQFQTTVRLRIFDTAGRTVYAKDRTSMWSSPDAYKPTLSYLLKRTPLH